LDNGQAEKYINILFGFEIHYKVAERTDELEAFNDADYASDPTT